MKFYDRSGSEIELSITAYTPFEGKKFCIIGDSFSQTGNAWHKVMCENLGAINLYNAAVGGARWSYNANATESHAYYRAQTIVSGDYEADVIMCCLGSNDAGNSVTMGEIVKSNSIDDFDLSTFTGGMQACLNYLQANFPNAKIFVGWTPAGANCNFTQAETAAPYVERMKEVCLMYGVEYIETRACGVTKYSDVYADLWEAGTGGGHPTVAGHAAIGNYMTDVITAKV